MGIYNKYILPKAINWACKQESTMIQRQKIIPYAQGQILEVGIGSGLNLPYYSKDKVSHLTAIDPSIETWNENKNDLQKLPFDFEFAKAFAESIPADSNSFDTVVLTYTLCTIKDTKLALEEIRRVLKNNGTLLFCEHGKAPDKAIQKWQNRINPLWKMVGGGCNLNKDIPAIIKGNGFKINKIESMYISGWKPASFNYWGAAKIRQLIKILLTKLYLTDGYLYISITQSNTNNNEIFS